MKNLLSSIYSFWQTLDFTSPRIINSLKTAIACIIGYILVLFTPLPQAQWMVITILIVMSAQASFGSLVIKSYMRFLGTLMGALISILVFLLMGTDPLGIGIILFICTFIFAYIASNSRDISAAGTMGAVTMAVILLNSVVNINTATARFLEIVIGIVIALLVSKFLFPIHAHTLLLKEISGNLLRLQRHFSRCVEIDPHQLNAESNSLDTKIVNSFTKQRKWIHEIGFEFSKYRYQKTELQSFIEAQVKIYRANNLMFMSSQLSPESVNVIASLQGLEKFKQEINLSLHWLSVAFRSEKKQLDKSKIEKLMQDMKYDFEKLVEQKQYENIFYINAFLFGAKMLVNELLNLETYIMHHNGLDL